MEAEERIHSNNITQPSEAPPVKPRSLVLRDWPRMLAILILVTAATAVAVAWVDLPLAQFVAGSLSQNGAGFVSEMEIPDLLDVFVAIVTVLSWIGYIILRRSHTGERIVCLLQVIGTALPFSYTAKDLLKAVFGRVNTRYWLDHPYHFEFRWLSAGDNFFGFPSGHMAIACAFAFAVMHYYPRLRPLGWLAMSLLGAALIVSEYHFLGDVISGAYIGYLAFVAARELPGAVPRGPFERRYY
ncbi:MAG TPA: phosphatase PAP2 family protein [Gammaproteobacteria bacterium]|nr:phosphatase PAP2 family protein [Gammaproteobacteria bacterium]